MTRTLSSALAVSGVVALWAGFEVTASFGTVQADPAASNYSPAVVAPDYNASPVKAATGPPAPRLWIPSIALLRGADTLEDWKLFQRGPQGHAPIPVRVTYASPFASRLEVRVVRADDDTALPGFGFADHDLGLPPAPLGATAEVMLAAVPQGGNYDIQVRLVHQADAEIVGTDEVSMIAVGDVFLAAGQSNMVGVSDALIPVEPPVPEVHVFGNDYTWKMAAEPMDDAVGQLDVVSLDTNAAHSPMLAFAKTVAAGAGVPIGIIPAPKSGSSIFGWARSAGDPADRGTLYGSALNRVLAQDYAHPIRGLLWYQGSSDVGNSTALYLSAMQQLVADYRSDLQAPGLFLASAQLATTDVLAIEPWMAIQEAQRQLALLDPVPLPGGSSATGMLDVPRHDGFHFTADGYKIVGARLGREVLSRSYGISQPLGPRLVSVAFGSPVHQSITVAYDRPLDPASGTDPFLWYVADGVGGVDVDGVTVVGNTVTLGLNEAAVGATTLSYGFSSEPTANWLRAPNGAGVALAFREIPVANRARGVYRSTAHGHTRSAEDATR